VTRVRDAKIIFNFFVYKNVCFEIMNWKYELIDITLILTLNDDILVTLNSTNVTLNSNININNSGQSSDQV
jgi:hypothetical protein